MSKEHWCGHSGWQQRLGACGQDPRRNPFSCRWPGNQSSIRGCSRNDGRPGIQEDVLDVTTSVPNDAFRSGCLLCMEVRGKQIKMFRLEAPILIDGLMGRMSQGRFGPEALLLIFSDTFGDESRCRLASSLTRQESHPCITPAQDYPVRSPRARDSAQVYHFAESGQLDDIRARRSELERGGGLRGGKCSMWLTSKDSLPMLALPALFVVNRRRARARSID